MTTHSTLDYIIENKEFTEKFTTVLEKSNVASRKQVFELLSAMCVYSPEGYARALEALQHYKTTKKLRYRFGVILDQLQREDDVAYKATLLGFINCLIIYSKNIEDRVRIRNEFIGLKLLEVLNRLRKLEDEDSDLTVQLYVFDAHNADDDDQLPGTKGLDLNSPFDVFSAIYKKVNDTPQEVNFLAVLRQLLQIDPNEPISDVLWQTVETLVLKATNVEKNSDAEKLIASTTKRLDGSRTCECCCHKTERSRHRMRGMTGSGPNTPDGPAPPFPGMGSPPPPPPPPPPPHGIGPPPPPPPPPPGAPPPPRVPPPPGAPPPPPPPGGRAPSAPNMTTQVKLPQQNIPKPKSKMRSLPWQKIPANKIVLGKPNMWRVAATFFNGFNVDFNSMDELFALNTHGSTETGNTATIEKKKKTESSEVNLLEGKRSLNVNIYLKQFKCSNREIVDMLRNGEGSKFGLERLKGLLKIQPDKDEIECLRTFEGDKNKLGAAEKFFLELLELPHYHIRIDGLLTKEEFWANLEWINPALDAVIETAKDVKQSKDLREVLYLVLLAGNYLNSGNYAGNAAGFKMSSLLKVTETRANKPRMNLMHYVVMQAEKKNPKLLKFADKFKFLKEAAQVSVDSLKTDISNLTNKVRTLTRQIGTAGKDLHRQLGGFLKESTNELEELEGDLKDLESLRLELAEFFCEDPSSFTLEECFKTLRTFCERFQKAYQENKEREILEEKKAARTRAIQLDSKPENDLLDEEYEEPELPEDEGAIVDMLLADVRSGFANSKTRDSNFSIKKVKKVNLSEKNGKEKSSDGDDKFVRGGYGRVSMKKLMYETIAQDRDDSPMDVDHSPSTPTSGGSVRRSRSGTADEGLFNFLTKTKDAEKNNEIKFDRVGSLRRRRFERRGERPSVLDSNMFGRERTASPSVDFDRQNSTGSDINSDSANNVTMRKTANRPNSVETVSSGSEKKRGLRRTQSLLDRKDMEQALSQSSRSNTPDIISESEESDGVLERSRRRLLRRSMRVKGEKVIDTKDSVDSKPENSPPKVINPIPKTPEPSSENDWQQRGSMRWRSNVPSDLRSLQTIVEKERLDTKQPTVPEPVSAPKIQKLSPEPPKSHDPPTPAPITTNNTPTTSVKTEENSASIEKSKEKLAKRYSAMDQDELDRILDSIGLTEICEPVQAMAESEKRHVSVSVRDKISRRWHSDLGEGAIDKVLKAIEDTGKPIDRVGNPTNLVKGEKPQSRNSKMDISASLSPRGPRRISTIKRSTTKDNVDSKDLAARNTRKQRSQVSPADIHKALNQSNQKTNQKRSPRTPTNSTRVARSVSLKDNIKPVVTPPKTNKVEVNDVGTPKLTGKRKFRADRFGDKESNEQSRLRSRSNVETEAVEHVLNDLQGNMSRSKSYDESVAKTESHENKQLHKDSNSNPEVSNSRVVRRNGSIKLSSNSRRHAKYIPNDDSDSDAPVSNKANVRRRKSKDSPKNSSIWSTNTSTETLRAENINGETTPEQRRKISNNSDKFVTERNIRNSVDHLTKQNDFEDDSPSAAMERWKRKRHGQNGDRLSLDNRQLEDFNGNKTDNLLHPDSALNQTYMNGTQVNNLSFLSEGSRASFASDRDEGFESQSQGTVSQRTSLCSGPEEGSITPTMKRRQVLYAKVLEVADDANNPSSSIFNDPILNKDRSDTWTDKDSLLNSSMDSSNLPLEDSLNEPLNSIADNRRAKSTDPTSRGGKAISLPSYMRGTSSSSKRTGGRESTGTVNKRPSSTTSRVLVSNKNLNKNISGSNTSVASTTPSDTTLSRSATLSPTKRRVLASSVQSPSSRLSAGTPSTSRSSTPSTTSSPFRRTQSVRLSSSARRSLGPDSSPSSGRETPSRSGVSKTPSFMAPTSASKQRIDESHKPERKSLSSSLSSPTQSSLSRTGSMRSSTRSPASNSTRTDLSVLKEKTKPKSDNKMKTLISKIGGKNKQDNTAENCLTDNDSIAEDGELENCPELSPEDCAIDSKDKSPSFFRRIVSKSKDRTSVRKSDAGSKVDNVEKKKRVAVAAT